VISARMRRAARRSRAGETARHPARQGQERAQVQDRLAALIGAEFAKTSARSVLDRDGEKRAEDHVGRGMAHHRLDVLFARLQPRHRRLARPQHRRKGVAQPPAFEGRVDDPPLPRPCLAIGQEDRIAQKRPQPFAHRSDFGKSSGRTFRISSTRSGWLTRKDRKNGVRNSAIHAR
jgi:hypothetical protein